MPSSKEQTPPHISIDEDSTNGHESPKSARSSSGWDGKLRVEKKLELANPEAISDPEYSDDEQVLPGETIEADEGNPLPICPNHPIRLTPPDLLDDYPADTTEIDCVHARVTSIPSLKLERFNAVTRLCLRQNTITEIEGLSCVAATLIDLDLYDNLIAHIRGLEDLIQLTSLDLSFNKIKHIKKVSHLVNLTDIYLVQNKIATIEGLDGLVKLRNLELAANRIREIQNLESLVALEELWLGKNKITGD